MLLLRVLIPSREVAGDGEPASLASGVALEGLGSTSAETQVTAAPSSSFILPILRMACSSSFIGASEGGEGRIAEIALLRESERGRPMQKPVTVVANLESEAKQEIDVECERSKRATLGISSAPRQKSCTWEPMFSPIHNRTGAAALWAKSRVASAGAQVQGQSMRVQAAATRGGRTKNLVVKPTGPGRGAKIDCFRFGGQPQGFELLADSLVLTTVQMSDAPGTPYVRRNAVAVQCTTDINGLVLGFSCRRRPGLEGNGRSQRQLACPSFATVPRTFG